MTTSTPNSSDAAVLKDHMPVPQSVLGSPLNDQGYYVGRVERNLFWVTDGTYQSAFLATDDGDALLGEVIAWSQALAPVRHVTQAAKPAYPPKQQREGDRR